MLTFAAFPCPVSSTILKIPLANPSELSPSASIAPFAASAISPASPCPLVLASTTLPLVKNRLVVVISIPPELPLASDSTRLKMPLGNPSEVCPQK